MPQYGRFKFGRKHRYGKYKTTTDDAFSIGPHVVYKIRHRLKDGTYTNSIRMVYEKIDISVGQGASFRIRANNGDWVRSVSETLDMSVYKVRVRSMDKTNTPTEWVYGERLEIEENKE